MRSRQLVIALVILLACTRCVAVLPHSGAVGQPASRLGANGAELGAAVGLQYAAPAGEGQMTAIGASTLIIPQVEANARFGLNKNFDLNLHLGAQGLQPGVKVGLSVGNFDVAALPAISVGIFRLTGQSSTSTYFAFSAGTRFLASHVSGARAALGYEFQYASTETTGSSTTTTTGHTVSIAFGYDFVLGALSIRPELAGLMTAGIRYTGNPFISAERGVQLIFLPTVTFAVAKAAAAPAPP